MEIWVSRPDLEALIGKDATDALCSRHGGISFYVPRRPKATMELAKLIGFEQSRTLCEVYGGSCIAVPLGNRKDPYKNRIMDMLDKGRPLREIARTLGTTERYVRAVARRYRRAQRQLTLL